MKLGIIGLPQAGKTTVFNALTRGNQPTTMGGGRFEVHTAVVDVPDPRLEALSAMFRPKKTTHAKVTYADIAGLEGSAAGGGISGPLLNELSHMDGFLLVLRCFEDPSVPHPAGSVGPQRDLGSMLSEFAINDLIAIERKLDRLEEERRKGGGREKALIQREQDLFSRLHAVLSDEESLRGMALSLEEEKSLSGFGFLSRKPLLVVPNLGEGQPPPALDLPPGVEAAPLMGRLEMEIAQLPPDEATEFLEEYGIQEPGLHRMIKRSYDLLGLISFFTVSDEEVRAWTLRQGASAPEAAGTVHTDMQKGFIRAEVIPFEELNRLGSLAAARGQGRLRVEGREYVVRDGEIVHIRFNV